MHRIDRKIRRSNDTNVSKDQTRLGLQTLQATINCQAHIPPATAVIRPFQYLPSSRPQAVGKNNPRPSKEIGFFRYRLRKNAPNNVTESCITIKLNKSIKQIYTAQIMSQANRRRVMTESVGYSH